MLNQTNYTWTKEDERREVAENLNCLIKFLEDKESFQHPHKYAILEYFPNKKPNTYRGNVYELTNLKAIIENGAIYFSDMLDEIYDGYKVLMSLLTKSVLYVGFQNEEHKITLSLPDGFIQIFY